MNSLDALGAIRWQVQLANRTGGTLRGSRDEGSMHDTLVGPGIRSEKRNLDLDVLRAFGDYSRNSQIAYPKYAAVEQLLPTLLQKKRASLSGSETGAHIGHPG